MTFGSEYPEACISTVSTPVTVRALVTDSRAPANPVYEYEYTTYVSSLTGYVTSTNSSKTMITTALAIADPVKVAWQTEDYKSFPSDYVSSLAGRFALSIPSPTPPGKNETPQSSGLSGGARIGIGLGAAAAALALLIGIVMLILKRRRRSEARTDDSPRPIAEMADQDHDLAKKKWWIGGRWRSEAQTHVDPQEMENKTVYVVPGPPAELDGAELSHPLESGRPVLRE